MGPVPRVVSTAARGTGMSRAYVGHMQGTVEASGHSPGTCRALLCSDFTKLNNVENIL